MTGPSLRARIGRGPSGEHAARIPEPRTAEGKLGQDVVVEGLGKRYGANWVVNDVSFTVPGGSFLSIVGPSGCGKSTTLRLLAGLDRPDSGEIRIGGAAVSSSRDGVSVPTERRNIGFVFQSYALWPHMTVFDHVAYPLRNRRLSRAAIESRVAATLKLVDLTDLTARYPAQLSGGQQQRVALARAFVNEPSILLLDEPLSNLDAALRAKMGAELRNLQQRVGFTAIYVTHDRVEALSLSDQIMVMDTGRAIDYGPPREVYERPKTLFSARVVSTANALRGVLGPEGTAEVRLADADGGILRIAAPSPRLRPGSDVWVAVRPESVRVAQQPAQVTENFLDGLIESVTYFGVYSEIVAHVGETQIAARINPDEAWDLVPGAPIRLVLPRDSLVVIPAD